jgi:hypothetical protein
VTEHELAILGLLAETLIPTDETPGADAAWARAFVRAHLTRHPEETAQFQALAHHLDALALAAHARSFDQLSACDRDALVAAHYPTLADGDDLAADERAMRQTMRDLMSGFLLADTLDLREDPLWLDPRALLRDRTTPSVPDYSTADAIPDLAIDRRMATNTGRGTYGRVWRAAGYPTPPGLPQSTEEINSLPELVTLRTKPSRP